MAAYSFLDVQASIVGPGGAFQLGSGSGIADAGIAITPAGDKNTMTVGADGSYMHSLKNNASGTVTVTLLRTSRTNAQLQNLYNFQTSSARFHGRNTILIRNPVSGDVIVCSGCAFSKAPQITYTNQNDTLKWEFHVGRITTMLGTGTPEIEN